MMTRVQILLPEDQDRRLEALAAKRRESVAAAGRTIPTATIGSWPALHAPGTACDDASANLRRYRRVVRCSGRERRSC